MKIQKVEIGKLFKDKENGDIPDFDYLYHSFEPNLASKNNRGDFEGNYLQFDSIQGLSPFVNGEEENYAGLGNVACGIINTKTKIGNLFFQILRRREYELLGIDYQQAKYLLKNNELKYGTRMYNQCAYTRLALEDVFSLLQEKVSISSSLVYKGEQKNFRLPDYRRTVKESPQQLNQEYLSISNHSLLLKNTINWFLEKSVNSDEKLCLLTKNLDINQKLLFLDQLQYFLFPFIGIITYQTEYVSRIKSIQLYIFDDVRYRTLCKKKEFSEFTILDEDSLSSYSAKALEDRFSVLCQVPHTILYSQEFKYFIDNGSSIETAHQLSSLINNQDADYLKELNYFQTNQRELNTQFFSYIVQNVNHEISGKIIEMEEPGIRLLEFYLDSGNEKFIQFADTYQQKFGFTTQVIKIMCQWIEKNQKVIKSILQNQTALNLLIKFYFYLLSNFKDENKKVRQGILIDLCTYSWSEVMSNYLKYNIRISELPAIDQRIFLAFLINSLNYQDMKVVFRIIDKFEITESTFLHDILNHITVLSPSTFLGQENLLLELVERYNSVYLIKNQKSVILKLIESQNDVEKINFLTRVFCNDPNTLDKWHFKYLVLLPVEHYSQVYTHLVDLCFSENLNRKFDSITMYPLVNNGNLQGEKNGYSYRQLMENPDHHGKLFSIFCKWQEKKIFSHDLFQLFIHLPDFEKNEQLFDVCEKTFILWRIIDHHFFAVAQLNGKNEYYYKGEVVLSLSIDQLSFFLTNENILKSFYKWFDYKQYCKNFRRIINRFDIEGFFGLLDSMPEMETIKTYDQGVSQPQILFNLCTQSLNEDFFKLLIIKWRRENKISGYFEKLVINKIKTIGVS